MNFNEMTTEQLKAYRASVETYGTASELYEVEMRIKELDGNHYRLPFSAKKGKVVFMFTNVKCKEWWKAAGVRAVKTMAQTAVALIGTSTLISDIDWVAVGSATLLAGVLSVLTSISGLPECSREVIEAKADLRNDDLEV